MPLRGLPVSCEGHGTVFPRMAEMGQKQMLPKVGSWWWASGNKQFSVYHLLGLPLLFTGKCLIFFVDDRQTSF